MQIELHDKQTLIDQLMNKSVVWVTNKIFKCITDANDICNRPK